MTNTAKMIKLDIITIKSFYMSYLVILFIIAFFSFMGNSAITVGITCAWTMAIMSSTIFSIEEKNNLKRLYGILSINSKNIVSGRYLFVLFHFILAIIVAVPLTLYIATFRNLSLNLKEVLSGISFGFLLFSLITSIQIPIYYKLGYTKGRFWTMIPFVLLLIPFIIPSFTKSFSQIIDFLLLNMESLIVICIFAGFILLLISYIVSLSFYHSLRKK